MEEENAKYSDNMSCLVRKTLELIADLNILVIKLVDRLEEIKK